MGIDGLLLSLALEKVNATFCLHLSPYAEIIESKVQEKGSRVNAASLCKNATRFSRVEEEELNCYDADNTSFPWRMKKGCCCFFQQRVLLLSKLY